MINIESFMKNGEFMECYASQVEALVFRKFRCEGLKCKSKEAQLTDMHYSEEDNKISMILECKKCHSRYRVSLTLHDNFIKLFNLRIKTQKELGEKTNTVEAFFYAIQFCNVHTHPIPKK